MLKVTYDKEANAAYIYLSEINEGEISLSVPVEEIPNNLGEVILDFDKDGKLRGVEILNADKILSTEVVASAQRIDA